MDLAILSSRIFTGDPGRPWAEALCIKDDRVAAIGTNAEARHASGPGTRVFEFPGRLVTPGIVDAHLHFVNFGLYLQRVDLRDLTSIAACRERVKAAVGKKRPGEWVIGRAWNEHIWSDRRQPNAKDLDDIAPDHPVMLVRCCGHSVWLNAMAMKLASITKETVDPPGARIERDAGGHPIGLCHEYRKIIERIIPPPTLEERKAAALRAQAEALRHGVTGVHTCETLQEWDALAALEAEGRLKVRVHHTLPPEEVETARSRGIELGKGSERLWFGQVKLFADGSLGSGTALLHAPYADDPASTGLEVLSVAEMQERIELAYRYGNDVAVHAIGDLATTNVLDAVEGARKRFHGPKRDRIEHVQLMHPSDFARFRVMDVVASCQPVHLHTDMPVAEKKWGMDRCRYGYAWKSMLKEGIRLQFGSDAPVESIDPRLSFHAALTRQRLSGEPEGGWFPQERLTLAEILHAFTAVPAWVSRKEHELGSLAPGKRGDLTVFSQDLFQTTPDQVPSVLVEMTVVNGEVLYHSDNQRD
ncbi:MAG TPA: amidohydrolase [Candidatus Methylomirabilis sp.]|nr:amidohydrolase [Candidatus Methylomirabilis sp.]